MSGDHPRPVAVRGGAAGLEVYVHDLYAVADRLERAAVDAGGALVSLHVIAADLGDALSAALDPAGFLRVQSRLLPALDGPHGLAVQAARCVALAGLLRGAAVLYQSTDDIGVYAGPLLAALAHLPIAVDAAIASGLRHPFDPTAPWTDLQAALAADPTLAPFLLAGTAGAAPGLMVAVGAVMARSTTLPVTTVPGAPARVTAPPRDVESLMQGLADAAAGGRPDGSVIVRFLYGADGSRRVVVDIRGMDGLTSPVSGVGPAAVAVAGRAAALQRGVVQAMQRAGVTATDDVMLVGHSEGGLVAVNLAADPARRFHVTHVITAGSPIGQGVNRVPGSVQVLAVENRGDIVPTLDGRTNCAAPNVTTVTVDHDDGDASDDHHMSNYVKGGQDIDASDDPSLQSYDASLSGYLHATRMTSRTYVITPAG